MLTKAAANNSPNAFRASSEGRPWTVSNPLVAHIQLKNRSALKPTLTVTQETIMHLCAEEYLTDDEIADRLHIAKATVRKHMQNIVQRLHCNTQRQAIAIWMNNHE